MKFCRDMAVFRYRDRFCATQLCCAIGLLAIGTAHAQPTETIPDPVVDGPRSVENYSLPPGQNDSSPAPAAEGPADELNPVPEPVEVGVPPDPLPSPVAPQRQIKSSAPVIETDPIQRPPPEINDIVPARPVERSAETQPPPVISETATVTEPSTETQFQSSPAAQTSDAGSSWVYWMIAGLLVVLIALIGGFFARRSRRAQQVKPEEILPATKNGNVQKSTTIPLPSGPAPTAVSAAQPEIDIIFAPQQATSTLLNAVVCYQLELRNLSEEDLTGIRLSGDLMQANEENARGGSDGIFPVLQQIDSLNAGQSITVTDEFRIPLATINPILFKAHMLFVPMARFVLQFSDDAGFTHFQSASFLVGQEHEPPRAKMAAFRLDLGPRTFRPIGCRPLQL